MQSPNKKAPTVAERAHIERVKDMDCIVCGASGPCDAHEINQGDWWTSLPLCRTCHMHPKFGFHGQKANWRAVKLDEVGALNLLIPKLLEAA